MVKNTNPASMTDEELDKELGIDPAKDPKKEPEVKKPDVPATPEIEELEEEVEEVEELEEEEPAPKVKDEPARREQLRIHQLLSKFKEAQSKPPEPKAPDALDYEKTIDADPELIKKLQADRDATNRAMYQQGIEQAKSIQFHTRLEIDAPRVEAKYPQLDKESKEFNPELANAVNTMFLSTVGYDQKTDTVQNPSLRYATYIDSIFELADEIAGDKTSATRKNISKQAAKTGLRPDGSGAKKMNLNKIPSQMTDEELDAVIGLAIPSK